MSDAFWVAFWANLPATLLAASTLVAGILLHFRAVRKLKETKTELAGSLQENTQIAKDTKADLAKNTQVTVETKETLTNGLSDSVAAIEHATNGMKDNLVLAAKREGEMLAALEFAKGLTAGKLLAEQQSESKKGTG